ncbi:DUF1351 domain-containing protein [Streptococcus equi subsp. equi]|nr:DUF1351 domain-containing protein [Streptococcus equi]MCD3519881.1 DUF1351 domain-containing protein [Streptococcus equi subsp. equi]MCD3531204.1 DUF1351 domain-containing protein [Streptococcus equi subsp. equi]
MSENLTLFENLNDIKPAEPAELSFDFEFTPAEIKIKGKEKLEEILAAYAKKYDGYTVTAETFEDDAKVRAKLNTLQKDINNSVKTKLAEYNNPLDDVKQWVNSIIEPIKKITKTIDEGVKHFEEIERQKRANTIKETFEAAIAETGADIDIRLFESNFDDMSAKGYFMADNVRVNTATKKAINKLVAEEVAKKQEHEQALIQISEAAAKADFGPAIYIKRFENGAQLADILQAIADDKLLADKVREEEKRKAELSKRVEEMTALAQREGLQPGKYVKLLEDGKSALVVFETLMDDSKKMQAKIAQKNAEAHQQQIEQTEYMSEASNSG